MVMLSFSLIGVEGQTFLGMIWLFIETAMPLSAILSKRDKSESSCMLSGQTRVSLFTVIFIILCAGIVYIEDLNKAFPYVSIICVR